MTTEPSEVERRRIAEAEVQRLLTRMKDWADRVERLNDHAAATLGEASDAQAAPG